MIWTPTVQQKDESLRQAGMGLTAAIRALHAIEEHGLALEALALANRVLQARQALGAGTQPVGARD